MNLLVVISAGLIRRETCLELRVLRLLEFAESRKHRQFLEPAEPFATGFEPGAVRESRVILICHDRPQLSSLAEAGVDRPNRFGGR